MRVEVDDFVEYRSNTLRGFFTVYFPEGGFGISGFSLHENELGGRWVEFPSKPNKNGEYEKVITAYDSRRAKKFKEQLLKLLDEHRLDRDSQAEKNSDPGADSQEQ